MNLIKYWRQILIIAGLALFVATIGLLNNYVPPQMMDITYLHLEEAQDSSITFHCWLKLRNENFFGIPLHYLQGDIRWKKHKILTFRHEDPGILHAKQETVLYFKGKLPIPSLRRHLEDFNRRGHTREKEIEIQTWFSPVAWIPPFLKHRRKIKALPDKLLWQAIRMGSGLKIQDLSINSGLKESRVTCNLLMQNTHSISVKVEMLDFSMKLGQKHIWRPAWMLSEAKTIAPGDSLKQDIAFTVSHQNLLLDILSNRNIYFWDARSQSNIFKMNSKKPNLWHIRIRTQVWLGGYLLPKLSLRLSPSDLLE